MGFLSKVQQLPEHKRRSVALIVAIILSSIIFFVWIAYQGVGLGETSFLSDSNIDAGSDEISPFSSMKEGFNEFFGSLKEQVDSMREKVAQ